MSDAVRPPPAPEPPDGGGGAPEWTGSQVLPHLFLGDLQTGTSLEDLRLHGITAVVNCTYEEPNFHEDAGILYHRVRLFDDTMQALTPERHLEPAAAFIEAQRRAGCRVLCHCRLGRSRSASIVLAYLMRMCNMSLRRAFMFLRKRREHVQPNHGFFKQLIDYERALRGANSLTMTDLALCPFCSRTSVFSVRITCGHNSCHSCFIRKLDEYNAARTLREKKSRSVAERLADPSHGDDGGQGHTGKAAAGVDPAGGPAAYDKADGEDCGLFLGDEDGGGAGGDDGSVGEGDVYGFGLCIADTSQAQGAGDPLARVPSDSAATVPSLLVNSSALMAAEGSADKAAEAGGQADPPVNSEDSSPGQEDPGNASATAPANPTAAIPTGYQTPTWAARSVDEYEDVEGFARRLVALAAEEGFELYCPQCDYMRQRQGIDRSPSILNIASS